MTIDEDSPIHRIRLRGPWEFSWTENAAGSSADRRLGQLTLPTTWRLAFESFTGAVRISRHFGRPAEPDPDDRIRLEIRSPHAPFTAMLNGERVGDSADGELTIDVTTSLTFRNRLELDLRFNRSAAANASLVEVALVFEASF